MTQTHPPIGARGLDWMAALWRALPRGTRRMDRQWFEELSEDVLAILPLFLRLANPRHRCSVIERLRLYEQFMAIEANLELAVHFRAVPQATATALIAEARAIWLAMQTHRKARR